MIAAHSGLGRFMTTPPQEVTQILDAIAGGDRHAAEQLLPLVYGELRKLAKAQMDQEAAAHTLQPTALVHEAYLRLVGDWVGGGAEVGQSRPLLCRGGAGDASHPGGAGTTAGQDQARGRPGAAGAG
jgi:hypothetical protein